MTEEEIIEKGKELAEKYQGKYWKLGNSDAIWQWDDIKETYVLEYSDKQL